MKKIENLLITSERIIKNEELVNLRGGDPPTDKPCCECLIGTTVQGFIVGSTSADCSEDCKYVYGQSAFGTWLC